VEVTHLTLLHAMLEEIILSKKPADAKPK